MRRRGNFLRCWRAARSRGCAVLRSEYGLAVWVGLGVLAWRWGLPGCCAPWQLVALGRDLWRQQERRARLRRIRADGRTRSLAHPGVAGCDGTSLVPGSGRGALRRQRTVLGI